MGRQTTAALGGVHDPANLGSEARCIADHGSGRCQARGMQLNPVREGGCGSPEPLTDRSELSPVRLVSNRNRKPRWRAAQRRALKEQLGVVANRHVLWRVTVTRVRSFPAWLKGKSYGLSVGTNYMWLRPAKAMSLIILDRNVGGNPWFIKAEFRPCDRCARPLIGEEAAKRRELLNSNPQGRFLPCGSACEKDRQSRLWRDIVASAKRERRAMKAA